MHFTVDIYIVPVQVPGLSGITDIAAGADHCLALSEGGDVYGWGANDYGQLGDGWLANHNTPLLIDGLSGITAVGAGSFHSLAAGADGSLFAFGDNWAGQIGNEETPAYALWPVQVDGLESVAAAAGGGAHSLAVENGSLFAWGDNGYGQLGFGTNESSCQPAQVPGLSGVATAAAGTGHSLAVGADGSLWAFGQNSYGQLGDGTYADSGAPVQVWGLGPQLAPESVAFGEDGYEAFIPSTGQVAVIPVVAKAYDGSGNEATATISYSLVTTGAGISVNSTTGAVTVTDVAEEGVATVRAVSGLLEDTVDLTLNSYVKLESEIAVSAELGGEYPVALSARYIRKYNWIGLTIEYDPLAFILHSVDAPARVAVTSATPGEVKFVADVEASDGAVPLLTLKAITATSSAIRVSSD